MAAGCGKVVVNRARASCVMLWHLILARMALRGAVRRAHSTQMHRIATLMGSGSSTRAITHSLSEWHCFWWFPPGAAYPPPKPAQAMPNLPILRFAPQPMPTLPMPQCIRPNLGNVTCMHCQPTLSPARLSRGNVASWLLEEEVPNSSASWSGTLTSLLNTPLRSHLGLP